MRAVSNIGRGLTEILHIPAFRLLTYIVVESKAINWEAAYVFSVN